MGHDPATSDPYELVIRQMDATASQARQAASVGGTAIFQVLAKLKSQIAQLIITFGLLDRLTQFLLHQTVTDFNPAHWTAPAPTTDDEVTGLVPYSASYDCEVVLVTTPSGRLIVNVSAVVRALNQVGVAVGFEATWAGGSHAFRLSRAVGTIVFSAAFDAGALTSSSHATEIQCPPNTEVTIRTRRSVWGTAGTGSGFAVDQSLIVTKQW